MIYELIMLIIILFIHALLLVFTNTQMKQGLIVIKIVRILKKKGIYNVKNVQKNVL